MEQSKKINSILQCFVDTNLELNENYPYRLSVLNNVFFPQLQYTVEEGSSIQVSISLSAPSTNGSESVVLDFLSSNMSANELGIEFPISLSWSEGEQVKNFNVPVSENAFVELNKSFSIIISSTFNCVATENQDKTLISVIDTTILRRVSFVENENSYILPFYNGAQNINYLSYSIKSNSFPTLLLTLDEPSQFGTEVVNVSIFTSILNPELITNKNVYFSIGEQYKEVVLDNVPPFIFNEYSNLLVRIMPELLSIENATHLVNYESGYSDAVLYVTEQPSPLRRRFTNVILKDVFRQKGMSVENKPLELRTVEYLSGSPPFSENENNWLLKFGSLYRDITNYNDNYFPYIQNIGSLYKFGIDFDGNSGELTLVVTNEGEAPVEINNNTYNPGENFEININTSNFQLSLPSNSNFQQDLNDFSTFSNSLVSGVYQDSLYSFKIRNNGIINNSQSGFYTHNFTPSDENGFPDNNVISLGLHSLVNFEDTLEAASSPLYLSSSYANVLTRYDGNSCTNVFSESNGTVDIRILGCILLDANNSISNYTSSSFISMEDFNPTCGELNESTGNPLWNGVQFELINNDEQTIEQQNIELEDDGEDNVNNQFEFLPPELNFN